MAEALGALDIEHAGSREEIDNQLAAHIPRKGIRQYLLKNLKRDEYGAFYWGINLKTINDNTFEILDKIETTNLSFNRPTLIVRGTKSDYINVDDILQFRKIFPTSTLHELDANHWVHVEKPKELTILLLDFLNINSLK
jgi:pimeloyl-ACP methyl ester carboxylesterase